MVQESVNRNSSNLCRVVVAHTGARNYYSLPSVLYEAGMLERFYTDIYLGNKPWLSWLLNAVPKKLRPKNLTRWQGRDSSGIPADHVTSFDLFGLYYWWMRWKARDTTEFAKWFVARSVGLNRRILQHKGLSRANVLWAFSGEAVELLQVARHLGMSCIIDEHHPPWKIEHDLMKEESERWPGWQPDLQLSDRNPMVEREEVELHLADRIVVSSEFAARGIEAWGISRERCEIVPYPVDLELFKATPKERNKASRKLRVLFVGEVGLRKGVPYLLQALSRIGPNSIETKIAGRVALAREKLKPYHEVAEFLGAIPRLEVHKLFQWADVFVFPTICESFGLVQGEALASGIPVVTTPNCGSVVRPGVDGEIVPIRDPEALVQVLERYIRDPDYLTYQQNAAVAGRQRLGFEAYKDGVLKVLSNL